MRSATTAESSDSIAPSIATVTAGEIRLRIRAGRNCGIWSSGRPEGMPPKREPMVATSRSASIATAVPPNSATM